MPSEQSSLVRKILHKRSNQSGRIPNLSALDLGELAINTYDGTLYTKVLRSGEESIIDLLADNSSYFSAFSVNYALSSITPSVGGNVVEGVISNILGGYGNLISGSGSTILGGENNLVDGDFSLSFGLDNNTQGHNNAILLGSGLSAYADNYTYVNNLSTAGNVEAELVMANSMTVNSNITATGTYYGVGANNPTGSFEIGAGNFSWSFNDGSLTLPTSGILQAANNSNLYIGSNLIPTTSAFYIGDINNPVNGIYLAANTLRLASTQAGVTGLGLSNIDNNLTIDNGGLSSTKIYTGGLLISGHNIGADPNAGVHPMTIGTNGLPAVEFIVPIKLHTTTGTPNVSGNASFTGNVSAIEFYGDGRHLINLPNSFDQNLNTTNNVSFSSLNLADGLTAHNTTIIGDISATGRIYASDVHAPLTVTDLVATTKTLALSDVNSIITGSDTSDMDIYIPNDSIVKFPIGTEIKFIQLGTKKMHINANTGVDLANSNNHFKTKGQHAVTWLFKVGADQWIFAGDTSA